MRVHLDKWNVKKNHFEPVNEPVEADFRYLFYYS